MEGTRNPRKRAIAPESRRNTRPRLVDEASSSRDASRSPTPTPTPTHMPVPQPSTPEPREASDIESDEPSHEPSDETSDAKSEATEKPSQAASDGGVKPDVASSEVTYYEPASNDKAADEEYEQERTGTGYGYDDDDDIDQEVEGYSGDDGENESGGSSDSDTIKEPESGSEDDDEPEDDDDLQSRDVSNASAAPSNIERQKDNLIDLITKHAGKPPEKALWPRFQPGEMRYGSWVPKDPHDWTLKFLRKLADIYVWSSAEDLNKFIDSQVDERDTKHAERSNNPLPKDRSVATMQDLKKYTGMYKPRSLL